MHFARSILDNPGSCRVTIRKPKRKTLSKAERDSKKLAEVLELLGPFCDAQALADLYARGEENSNIDGYPAGSDGGSSIHGGISDPTGQLAALVADGFKMSDHLLERIGQFQSGLSEVHGITREMRKCANVVLLAADSLRGRQSALQGDCLKCQKPVSGVGSDRMRSGLCHSCSNGFYEDRSSRPGLSVAEWLGNLHPLANRRPAPVASREEVVAGVTYSA